MFEYEKINTISITYKIYYVNLNELLKFKKKEIKMCDWTRPACTSNIEMYQVK